MSNSGFDHLAKLHPHPRDGMIRFEDEGHRYYLFDPHTGEWDLCTKANGWVSSTGIGAALFPFNALAAARCIFRGKNFATGQYKDLKSPQDIVAAWGERAKRGTYFHEKCPEAYYNNIPIDHDDPEIAELVPKFLKFAEDHQHLEPWRTEWLVYDQHVRVSGSIDMVFREPDGSLSLYDWKRVDHILPEDGKEPQKYKRIAKKDKDQRRTPDDLQKKSKLVKYSLQLAVYKYILEKSYNVTIKDVYLIRFHPSLETYEKIKCFDMDNEIDLIMTERLELMKDWSIVKEVATPAGVPSAGAPEGVAEAVASAPVDELAINLDEMILV